MKVLLTLSCLLAMLLVCEDSMAVYRGLSRQFRSAANRSRRYETPKTTYHAFRNAQSPEDLTPQAPEMDTPVEEKPLGYNVENVLSGGTETPSNQYGYEYSPTPEQALVDSWTTPDDAVKDFAVKRATSGLVNTLAAKAAGFPLSVSGKFGLTRAINPPSVMLAMANDFVPGLLAKSPANERLTGVLNAYDDPKQRQEAVGLFSDLEALSNPDTRDAFTPEQKAEVVNRLHAMGMDDYIDMARVRSAAKQASRPLSTQIMDPIADKLELAFKSLVGISQEDDLARMIADDEPSRLAMSRPSRSYDRENAFTGGSTGRSPAGAMGPGKGTGMAGGGGVESVAEASERGRDYGGDGGGRGGVGSSGGGRAASDAGMAGENDAGGLGGFGSW